MSESGEGKQWLSVEEVSAILPVSKLTLYRVIAAGEFPAVRIGRRLCVPAAALDGLATAALESGAVINAADWRQVLAAG
jgi:excisionase family DNA binding protein